MKWKKIGLIYNTCGKNFFDNSHCHKPTPIIINNNTVRVFFGTRDKLNKTRTTFIDLDSNNLKIIKYIHTKPVLDLGKIGTFDDCGVNVSSILKNKNALLMYYIGWNPSTTVHTRNSIGIAISYDNGITFSRLYDGPILDRNKEEPYYTGAVDVLKEKKHWKMWYTSGTGWKMVDNKPEIFYHIKYATSRNGLDWVRNNTNCINPSNRYEATARPCILKMNNIYKMWYSKRDIRNFRTNKSRSYRPGYAESYDGINWDRKDHLVGIKISKNGWDSTAIAYPYVIKVKDKLVMFYNGNDFGKSGFGAAIYEE